jgi:tRNA1Val (adenine37-N6)-methyltransferase
MKVGTDGVLLGSWANVSAANAILDIGTGSGLIALMLAQRTHANTSINAVEIDSESAIQATDNVRQSPWPEKIKIHTTSIQDFKSDTKYDLIVSNPPFFVNSLSPPSEKRKSARHSWLLPHQDLLHSSQRLISDKGILTVILPVSEGNDFIATAQFFGFYLRRQGAFYTRDTKPQERWLFEFAREPGSVDIQKLVLYDGDEWSIEYKKLVSDFYLSKT